MGPGLAPATPRTREQFQWVINGSPDAMAPWAKRFKGSYSVLSTSGVQCRWFQAVEDG